MTLDDLQRYRVYLDKFDWPHKVFADYRPSDKGMFVKYEDVRKLLGTETDE